MPLHRFPPRLWPALRLRQGLCSRLPAHCLRALQEDELPAAPVHWRPQGARYRRDPRSGERQRLQDVPVLPFLPPAAHRGLWGGEGWVRGFRYARNDKVRPLPPSSPPCPVPPALTGPGRGQLSTRLPKVWKPQLFERRLYSEILDATLTVTVTMRTLDLIDQAYGFDFYILKARAWLASGDAWGASSPVTGVPCGVWTPKADLGSKLGMDLKRTMLLRLARRDPKLHPDDPARREAIYDKYKEFVIPEEEAEWVGLSLEEAIEKQRLLEKKDPVPLFKVYAEELVNQLKEKALQKQ
ncbi:39S ribosomal protein L28, mitochondrial [Aix galericulata]|nr:39S ribosomal protein L28, mitochondrial [Aix galericulata]